ncbi:MAG: hypothetical protein MUF18_14030 [Fimbriiglobus sp.]|jgi:hypothetical protein|nr:hypothetical protein [Fimbriiglobus sp.]
MSRFWPRALKSVLPVVVVCGGAGYLYALGAAAYVADGKDDATTLRTALSWRLPLAMACWGGGVTLIVEFFRQLWAPRKADEAKAESPAPPLDAERLLLQLIEQAEEAERSRAIPMPGERSLPPDPAMTPPPPEGAILAFASQATDDAAPSRSGVGDKVAEWPSGAKG